MSVNEIASLETTATVDTDIGETVASAAEAAASGENASVAAETGDRLAIGVLSKEPVLRFEETTTGALGVVSVNPDTGMTSPLGTGINEQAVNATILSSAPGVLLGEQPIIRERENILTGKKETEVLDPNTGQLIDTVGENDSFDLEAVLREYRHRSLIDKST